MNEHDRHDALDEPTKRSVLAVLTLGGTRRMAALKAGCTVQAIHRAALDDADFAKLLAEAEMHFDLAHMTNLLKSSEDARYWRASFLLLERRMPDRFGKRDPETIAAERAAMIAETIAQAVSESLRDAEDRRRVLERLEQLAREIASEE